MNTNEINKILKEKLQIKNSFAVPKITKVVINVGIGANKTNPSFSKNVEESLRAITGQKPAYTIAKKAISGFKIRENEKIGMKVTLRGKKMNDFLTKLANIVMPRIRDFRGFSLESFDKNGNFNLGISENIIFPEISHEKAEMLHGMSITINTTAETAQEGKELLLAWGFPFNKNEQEQGRK